MPSWRARKAVLASRGEVAGPRVEECNAALAWWRHRTYLIREMGVGCERADELLDQIDQHSAEPVDAPRGDDVDSVKLRNAVNTWRWLGQRPPAPNLASP